MDIKIWDVVKVSVVGTDIYNGQGVYRVSYKGRHYRVKWYPGQPKDKKTIYCTCVGFDSDRRPKFEQNYTEILPDLYKAGNVYPFKLTGEFKDIKTGTFYYQLEDESGLKHRIYMKQDSSLKVGDMVQAKVMMINPGYLSLELMPKGSSKASPLVQGEAKSL